MAKMKEQNKTSEKELNETDIVKLSEAEFKTLVIRMLGELTEYGNNIKGEMKATLSEIKKNPQGTNNEGKEPGIPTNNLEQKEEINIQPEQKQEFKKMRVVLRQLWDISKCANIQIIRMPEEEEGPEIENLF